MITMHEDPSFWESIRRSGARGLVSKSRPVDELTSARKTIIADDTYFH
jgi:DNA-binding NarL/FixJ family response regulator